MHNDEIMTVDEVAKYLKLKSQTVYKWAQQGKIPGTKLGKSWRFRRRVLDEWIDTSITLSQGGFDLMMNQGMLAVRRQALTEKDVDRLVAELGNDTVG